MRNTVNFNLTIPEGSDNVNILTQITPNFETIDGIMKDNENAGVQVATELYSNNIHAITRTKDDAPVMRFTATSRFTIGDTFTVDGVQVTALAPTGEQLPDGAFIVGSEVLAILKGTLLTIFAGAKATDSAKLNGQNAGYYATKTEVDNAQSLAESATTLAQSVDEKIEKDYTLDENTVNLTNYNKNAPYICDSDVIVQVGSALNCTVNVMALTKGRNDTRLISFINDSGTGWKEISCYLRKGMKLYATLSDTNGFALVRKIQ